MSDVTEADVVAAQDRLAQAKSARGNAKQGTKHDEYREASEALTDVRSRFRAQEEQAGNRAGFVSGDAAN